MRFLRRKVTFVILSVAFVLMCAFVPYNQIMLISNGDVLTRSEFEKLTKTQTLNPICEINILKNSQV